MRIEVLLFASAREILGVSQIEVSLESNSTVSDLRTAIAAQFPALRELTNRSAIAIDQKYATDEIRLSESLEVGLIPPVSGG